MRSMRVVTQNPPVMLIVASSTAAALSSVTGEDNGPEICSIPPTRMMPLMAFVTLIKGVCKAGVTFHTTCQPTKHASTTIVRCEMNSFGATEPSKPKSSAPESANAELRSGWLSGTFGGSATCTDMLWGLGGGGRFAGADFGGGQTILPSCSTIAPRTTASSRSTCQLFAPPMSANKCVRLLPYSWLAVGAKRLG